MIGERERERIIKLKREDLFCISYICRRKITLSNLRYVCEEEFCQNGLFIPPQCEDGKCGTLLADFPGIQIYS